MADTYIHNKRRHAMHQQLCVVPRLLAAAALCFGAAGASAQVVVFEENFSNGLG